MVDNGHLAVGLFDLKLGGLRRDAEGVIVGRVDDHFDCVFFDVRVRRVHACLKRREIQEAWLRCGRCKMAVSRFFIAALVETWHIWSPQPKFCPRPRGLPRWRYVMAGQCPLAFSLGSQNKGGDRQLKLT